jgi:hypothetical protein
MDEKKIITHAGPVEILAEWEGAAIHEPGVLFEESHAEHLAVDADAAELAGWIAVSALAGVGHPACDAIKAKVRGVLAACRQRHGQARLDEIKKHLFRQMQQPQRNRKLTDAELRERIELLFRDLPS